MTAQENRWLSEEHARDWLARQSDRGDAGRPEQFDLLARLLPFEESAALSIVDLGAGHGTLSEVLLDRFPRARALCLDVNPAMIEAGQDRLSRFGPRARYARMDLGGGWPAEASGPFDAVVSSRAIHHLNDEGKRALFAGILARLRPGGWFLNFDYVRAPSELLSELYVRALGDADGPPRDHHQGHHSHTSPLASQLDMLGAVGFEEVDCFWKHLATALYGGRKP
ncbi:MAG: methyltransferase domain-containing protein [Chloroflexota bacterium]|nr:methyltransferase domain-containing protein [Chloroflexota bacterium]